MIRTLIVDDDSLIHVTLRSMIDWERYGYTVVQDCSGGDQVLHYLREHSIDLLLTDMKMPGMSGLELLRRLRQSSSMPVTVVLSGYDEFDLVREAFRLGAYDYLLKANISPAGIAQLLNGLRSKVFRDIPAGGDAPSDSLQLEPGDYAVVVFHVRHFARDAQRFGDNLRERLVKPMVELVQQIRRLQGRAWLRAKDPSCYLLSAILPGTEPQQHSGYHSFRGTTDSGRLARFYELGNLGGHQRCGLGDQPVRSRGTL